MKDKITSRQAGMITAFIIFSNKILILPSLISQAIRGDGFLLLMMMLSFELLFLGSFFLLKRRYPSQSLFNIISSKCGKWLGYVVYAIFTFYFFIKIYMTFTSTHSYLKVQVYRDSTDLIFLICFFVITNQMVWNGIRNIARTIEFFFFIVVVGLCFSIFIGALNFQVPLILLDSQPTIFFSTGLRYIISFGDYLFLFLIMDKIDMGKKGEKRIFSYSLLAIGIVLAIYFIFLSLYQHTGFVHANAISDIISLTFKLFEVGRVDIIAVLVIMFLAALQLVIFVYAFVTCFNNVFPLLKTNYCIGVFDILFIIGYYCFFQDIDLVLAFCDMGMKYVALVIQYLIPALFLLLLIKRKKKRRKREESN